MKDYTIFFQMQVHTISTFLSHVKKQISFLNKVSIIA